MNPFKALFVQNGLDYLSTIESVLKSFLWRANDNSTNMVDLIEWILEEEVEKIYYLHSPFHSKSNSTYQRYYDMLRNELNGMLSIYTAEYIKAPSVYPDNRIVRVKLINRDVHIWYFKTPYPTHRLTYTRT